MISAIDDPIAGAAVMMIAICHERGPLKPESEAAIAKELRDTIGVADPTEPVTFAKWAAEHVTDANDVSRKLARLWIDRLGLDERRDLLGMVSRVAAAEGAPTPSQRVVIQKLRERLALLP